MTPQGHERGNCFVDLNDMHEREEAAREDHFANMGSPNGGRCQPNPCYAEEEDEYNNESKLVNPFAGN